MVGKFSGHRVGQGPAGHSYGDRCLACENHGGSMRWGMEGFQCATICVELVAGQTLVQL